MSQNVMAAKASIGSATYLTIEISAWNKAAKSEWLLDQPLLLKEGDELTLTLAENNVGCAQLLLSPLALVKPVSDQEMARVREGVLKGDATARETYVFSTGQDAQALLSDAWLVAGALVAPWPENYCLNFHWAPL